MPGPEHTGTEAAARAAEAAARTCTESHERVTEHTEPAAHSAEHTGIEPGADSAERTGIEPGADSAEHTGTEPPAEAAAHSTGSPMERERKERSDYQKRSRKHEVRPRKIVRVVSQSRSMGQNEHVG